MSWATAGLKELLDLLSHLSKCFELSLFHLTLRWHPFLHSTYSKAPWILTPCSCFPIIAQCSSKPKVVVSKMWGVAPTGRCGKQPKEPQSPCTVKSLLPYTMYRIVAYRGASAKGPVGEGTCQSNHDPELAVMSSHHCNYYQGQVLPGEWHCASISG